MRPVLFAGALLALVAGFSCSRVDLQTGRAYRCAPDGGSEGQCAADWVCALDGYCHDPRVGEPLPCLASADCTGGWHCGVRGVCYDRGDAGGVECRAALDDTDGGDCAPGWRCSIEGACVDVRAESLRPAVGADSLSETRISPVLPGDPRRYFTGDPQPEGFDPTASTFSTLVREDGGLLQIVTRQSGDGGLGSDVYFRPVGDFLEATATGDQVETLRDGGEVMLAFGPTAGKPVLRSFHEPLEKLMSGGGLLIGWSAQTIGAMTSEGSQITGIGWPQQPPGFGEAAFALRDDRRAIFLSSQHGVWLALGDETGFRTSIQGLTTPTPQAYFPVALPGISSPECGQSAGAVPTDVRAAESEDGQHSLVVETLSGGAPRLSLYVAQSGVFAQDPADCSSFGFIRVSDQCQPCPDGASLVDFRIGYPYEVKSLCRRALDADRVELTWYQLRIGDCLPQPLGAGSDVDLARIQHGRFPGYVSPDGRLFACTAGPIPDGCQPLLMSGPPSTVALLEHGGVVVRGRDSGDFVSTAAGLIRHVSTQPGNVLLGQVSGRPEWLLVASERGLEVAPQGDSTRAFAVASGSGGLVQTTPPAFGARVQGADQREYLVLAAGDTVWATTEAGFADSPDAGELEVPVRAVPLPKGTITSFALQETAPAGGPVVSGYLIAQERLFRLQAETPVRWRAQEVLLGERTPLSVWFDGDRARAGFDDGTVISLPGRVELSAPIGETVLDYAALCGDAFALTGHGLFVLRDRSGQWKGSWEDVALDTRPARAWSRLASDGRRLLLFSDDGTAAALQVEDCPQ